MENEIPKYRKKANKTVKRADHKHTYVECIITDGKDTERAIVCTKCLKIYNRFLLEELESSRKNCGAFTCLSYEEMLTRYPNHPIYKVEKTSDSKTCLEEIKR